MQEGEPSNKCLKGFLKLQLTCEVCESSDLGLVDYVNQQKSSQLLTLNLKACRGRSLQRLRGVLQDARGASGRDTWRSACPGGLSWGAWRRAAARLRGAAPGRDPGLSGQRGGGRSRLRAV